MAEDVFFKILAKNDITSQEDLVLGSLPVLKAFGEMNLAIKEAIRPKAEAKPEADQAKPAAGKTIFGSGRGRANRA